MIDRMACKSCRCIFDVKISVKITEIFHSDDSKQITTGNQSNSVLAEENGDRDVIDG